MLLEVGNYEKHLPFDNEDKASLSPLVILATRSAVETITAR